MGRLIEVAWEAHAPRVAVDWIRDAPDERHRTLEGGVLFLDVSGFTALSEMLAGLGRVGAEEITEVIGETFERLLAPAYEDGGTMLCFGGDALLLLFEGEDGGPRAARAAHEMRGVLRTANPVVTRAGDVELGVTMGVHLGQLDLVLAGQSARHLVVLGPDVSEVLRVEGSAERDQVLVSRALAARLPPDVLGGHVGDGVELVGPPAALPPIGLGPPKPASPSARSLLSPDVAAHLAAGGEEGEHRVATMAFVHVDGTDELRRREGVGAVVAAVDELVAVVQAACDDTGTCLLGVDVDVDGAKLVLAGGIPRTRGDDTDRLLAALRRVVEAPRALTVRIGAARGPVFVGALGPPYRRTFTALGDTVNLAARVMAHAGADEVLATPETLNAARTLFDVDPREPFVAKGKSVPVRTLAVGPEIGIRLRMRPDDHALVGRTDELDRLGRLAERALAGDAGIGTITGPAGIGKSRLVDELQHAHARLPFVLAASQDAATDRPYYAAAQWVRAVVGGRRTATDDEVLAAAAAVLPEEGPVHRGHLPLLGTVLGTDLVDTVTTAALQPRFRVARTRELVRWLLGAARPGPLALVLEDAQWLDPESADLVAALTDGSLVDHPWLVLVTAREAGSLPDLGVGVGDPSRVDVTLRALEDEDARALVLQDVEAGHISMDRVDDLLARSGGNPLFLTELTAAMAAGAEGSDELEQVFRQRLDLLGGTDRRVLGQAAVLGVEFPPELLALVAGPAAVGERQLARLADFLRPMRSGPLRFNQTLYQEVAYAAIPFRRRAELHAKAARAIESLDAALPDRDDQLSRHWHLAGQPDRAWPHTIAAADRAAERHAPTTAARLYRRALEDGRAAGRPSSELGATALALGTVLDRAGAYADAVEVYELALADVDAAVRPLVHERLAATWEKRGDYEQALRWLDVDATAGRSAPSQQVLRSLVLNRMGRFDAAQRSAIAAAAAADPSVRGRALWALSWASDSLGDPDYAVDVAGRAVELFESSGAITDAAKARNSRGAALYRIGRWDEATDDYRRSAAHERRAGDRVNAAVAQLNIAEIRSDQGHLVEAGELFRAAHQVFVAARHPAAIAFAEMHLGRLAARRGEDAEAEEWLARALGTFLEIDAASLAPEARARQAEAALFAGHHRGALERCDGVLDEPADLALAPLVLRVAGCASWYLGEARDTERLLTGSLQAAIQHRLTHEQLMTEAAAALLIGAPPPSDERVRALGIVDLTTLAVGPRWDHRSVEPAAPR